MPAVCGNTKCRTCAWVHKLDHRHPCTRDGKHLLHARLLQLLPQARDHLACMQYTGDGTHQEDNARSVRCGVHAAERGALMALRRQSKCICPVPPAQHTLLQCPHPAPPCCPQSLTAPGTHPGHCCPRCRARSHHCRQAAREQDSKAAGWDAMAWHVNNRQQHNVCHELQQSMAACGKLASRGKQPQSV